MNRYIKVLLIIVMTFIMRSTVFAKVSIPDTKIVDIKVPENWKLITKDNINEMMDWLGFDASKKITYKYAWNSNSYHADIVSESKDKEIILISKISDFEIDDLSIYLDEDITKSFDKVKESYKEYNPKVSLYKTNDGIKYYKIEYADETLKINLIDYLTTIHGNLYQYKFQSSSDLTDDTKNDVENVINSIEYEDYLSFIEKNKMEKEEKKSNSPIIIVIIFIIIIVVGVITYIFINKKKSNKQQLIQPQVYNPVQNNAQNPDLIEQKVVDKNLKSDNPAVADFLNQDNSENNN